ncbi:MAG TPA: hypothetical protein VN515_10555 [Terriglobales bacterium]|nr:hypothetical protein [Terriglobales bacterium]
MDALPVRGQAPSGVAAHGTAARAGPHGIETGALTHGGGLGRGPLKIAIQPGPAILHRVRTATVNGESANAPPPLGPRLGQARPALGFYN